MPRGFVLWFTGLSGSGKSTLTSMVAAELRRRGVHVETLDGDEIRKHLSKGLGFSRLDRDENIRRIGFVAKLVSRSGACAIAATISPYRDVRNEIRSTAENFIEVYTECPISVLSERDPKGLYKKALAGEIRNFTGVDDPYEAPESPEVHLHTDRETQEESLAKILARLEHAGLIPAWGQWQRIVDPSERQLVAPHGLDLVDRTVPERKALPLLDGARDLPVLDVDFKAHTDLCYLATGAYSPLRGFMTSKDYLRVVNEMRLENGLPWGIPVTLPLGNTKRSDLGTKDRVLLRASGRPIAILGVEEIWKPSPNENDAAAPSNEMRSANGANAFLVGGEIECLDATLPAPLAGSPTPAQTREKMRDAGWSRVATFSTSSAPLAPEEYIARAALDFSDGLMVQPTADPGDALELAVRVRCFEALFERYFAAGRTLVAPRVIEHHADPVRVAIHDAIVAKNFGASRVLLVEDEGLSPEGGLRWLDRFSPRELGVELWRVAKIVSSERLGTLATRRSAPDQHATYDAEAVFAAIRSGTAAPSGVRPEIAQILRREFAKHH